MSADPRVRMSGRVRDDPARPAYAHVRAHAMPIHIVPDRPLKKRTSIEDLLVWAYRDQMVHVAREAIWLQPSPGGPRGFDGYGFKLDVIDSSANGGFTAAPDAFVVAAAVKALGPVREPWPRSQTPAGSFPLPWLIGGMIVVDRAHLLWTCALRGEAPDWIEHACTRLRSGNVVYDARSKRALFCEVHAPADLPWDVARARFVYWCWWSGLDELRRVLAGRLERYELSEAMPRERPWRDDDEG